MRVAKVADQNSLNEVFTQDVQFLFRGLVATGVYVTGTKIARDGRSAVVSATVELIAAMRLSPTSNRPLLFESR